MLGESAIAVRTKAMKCLSEVVAVDPSILARVGFLSFSLCNIELHNKMEVLVVGSIVFGLRAGRDGY